MRILADIPDRDLNELARIGKRRKVSRAAVIRDAVTSYLAAHRPPSNAMDQAFGLWGDQKTDGLAYQKKMRAEW